MKKLPYILIVLIFLNGLLACSKQSETVKETPKVQEIVVINDGYKTDENGQLIIDDQDVRGKNIQIATEKSEEETKVGNDGSQIKIMKDGYGNKTITRFFYDHPLISGIVTRVSAKGISNSFVYTKDGLVKQISDGLNGLIESASASEIAKKVGIFSLNKNNVYEPMLAKIKDQNEDSISLPNSEIPNNYPQNEVVENQITTQPVKPPKEEIKAEMKVEKPIQMTTDNTFLNEFEAKVEKQRQVAKRTSQK